MTRSHGLRIDLVLLLLTASGLAPAQQGAPTAGGWRRVGEAPPASEAPPDAIAQSQDPTQPVDRTDAYGQQLQAPPPATADRLSTPQSARPAYGLPPELTLKPGTYVTIRTNEPLSSDHNQPGDTFLATLAQPVVVDGIVVASRGETVYGRVVETQKARQDRSSRLGLELTSLTLADGTQVPVRSQLVAREGGTTPVDQQAGTVAATTGIGAIIGAAADWGTGAAIGAGVGAAAGLIGVMVTRNRPTVVYPETALTFRIESPVTISTAVAPQAFRYVGPNEYNRPPQFEPRPARGQPYNYPPAYYPPPYPYYGGYYFGPGVSIVWGPGYFYGRGHYRRWR